LCARRGLYEVTEVTYQVRDLDLSNMTLVEGDAGVRHRRDAIEGSIGEMAAKSGLSTERDRAITVRSLIVDQRPG
jgi:alkyl sulfatase BDS1-like metallo-beta-lactamase superfamily hydrolase